MKSASSTAGNLSLAALSRAGLFRNVAVSPHTDHSTVNAGCEQGFSETIESVGAAVPFFKQTAEESMSGQLALGHQLSEAMRRQHLELKHLHSHTLPPNL